MIFCFRLSIPACVLVVGTVWTTNGECFCQENPTTSSKPVLVEYIYLAQLGPVVPKSFDIGEVGIGEEVPVLIHVLNRSKTPFVLSQAESKTNTARLLNGPVKIPDGENGLVEMVVQIPDVAKGLTDGLVVRASLGDNLNLQLGFSFRYRDLAVFTKNFSVFALEVPDGETTGRRLTVQLPVEVSDANVLDHISVDVDASLQGLGFSVVKRGSAFIEGKVPSELIAKSQISGRVRLKVYDKVVSETTLVIKKRSDIELLPDYVTLRFDPAAKEFRGELIAKLLSGTSPIEHVQIEAEHVDLIPIEISVGKMSNSTGRVYLRVKGTESPKNDDLILFRISTPLKTEQQVLPVVIVR